jgi:hypothetical protein
MNPSPRSLWSPLLLGAGFGIAFLLGQLTPALFGAGAEVRQIDAQGRGPVNPPPAPTPTPETGAAAPALVYTEDNGHIASSNNGFLAVTGSYGVGTSVLYLVDTVSRQLAVYEARGGSAEQRRIVLVGARRIDLDLQLRDYNDRSEYDHAQLEQLFQKNDRKAASGKEPATPELPSRK